MVRKTGKGDASGKANAKAAALDPYTENIPKNDQARRHAPVQYQPPTTTNLMFTSTRTFALRAMWPSFVTS